MKQSDIANFFYQESDSKKRFEFLNFLCQESDLKPNKHYFSKALLEWIGFDGRMATKLGLEKKYLDAIEKIKTKTSRDSKRELVNYRKELRKKLILLMDSISLEWVTLVSNIQLHYDRYLNGFLCSDSSIKYIIISEAPLLTLTSNEKGELNFECKYIFSSTHEKVGNYRTAPYKAICSLTDVKTVKDINSGVLEELFKDKRVLFLDLIPVPLPKIDSELRKKWSTDDKFFIDGRPRVISFLEASFEYVLKFAEQRGTKISFDKEVQIALMMPANSALGIINYYINKPESQEPFKGMISGIEKIITRVNNNSDAALLSDLSLRLHRQIVMGATGFPDEKLLKHALS
jgi:hypothetical protein